jgi:hypothetical protein
MGIRDPGVLQEIGRVAVEAALLEQKIHMVYWRYAGVGEAMGQVITETARPSRLFEGILKLAIAARTPPGRLEGPIDLLRQDRAEAQ